MIVYYHEKGEPLFDPVSSRFCVHHKECGCLSSYLFSHSIVAAGAFVPPVWWLLVVSISIADFLIVAILLFVTKD